MDGSACLTLAHYNYLLSSFAHPRAFRCSLPRARKEALGLVAERPEECRSAMEGPDSPFRGARITPDPPKSDTVEALCLNLSRGRYLPTKSPIELLPALEVGPAARETIALSCPTIEIGTLRRVSPSSYAALVSRSSEIGFIHRSHATTFIKEKSLCRLAHRLMRWASDSLPGPLRVTRCPPSTQGARKVAQELAVAAQDYAEPAKAPSFYLKCLIPYVAENMLRLESALLHEEEPEHEEEPASDGGEICVICQSSMLQGGPSGLPYQCSHPYHLGCIAPWGDNTCPVCRAPPRARGPQAGSGPAR